jgi:hypothetical protein
VVVLIVDLDGSSGAALIVVADGVFRLRQQGLGIPNLDERTMLIGRISGRLKWRGLNPRGQERCAGRR